MRVKSLFLVATVLALIAATGARAQVFTKNQILLAGSAPSIIPVSYDAGISLTGTIPLGAPVHIVYGVQVTSSNTSSTPVSLGIMLPPTFTKTQVQCVRFAAGLNPGAAFTAGCATPTLAIGALSAADDKVIVAIDGYFTQAGSFTVNFAASRGTTTEPTSLNMAANTTQLPADLEVIKLVKPKTGGTFGPTATIPFGGTVTYQVTVKNISTPDPTYHTSDVYAGPLLKLQDTISTPGNDVNLNINAGPFSPCTATGGADCPTLPASAVTSIAGNSGVSLFGVNYPATSNGFLPAGGSFTLTFDAVITTGDQCSPGQNNKLLNAAGITYSNSTNTISDTNPLNNASTATVTLTGLPKVCPPPPPALPMRKELDPGTPAAWGAPMKYKITIKNNTSQTLTGLTLNDYVSGNGAPPFTATFSAASVVCTPACIAPQPVNSAPYVTNLNSSLFVVAFAPLAPGVTQVVEYIVRYDAICSITGGGGSIINQAWLNGPANSSASVVSEMPDLPKCEITVDKKQVSGPTAFSSFPVTLGYKVRFKNNSPSQTVKIGTLVDAIAYESQAYAVNIPVDYSYTCTASSNVTMPAGAIMSQTNVSALIQYNNPVYAGVRIFDFSSSPGAVFGPLATLSCDVSVTLKQPPTTDSKCQGKDPQNVVNTAIMDLYPGNYSSPAYKAPVATPLPKCISIFAGKTVSSNVFAGGPVTFTLTVKNSGDDPVSDVLLTDNVPPGFTGVSWTCASGCSSMSGSGNNISVALTPIAPGATTTIVVTAIAPTVLGTYCNKDEATFTPFPSDTFFEGDQAALTSASACVQVKSPPEPKLTKTFDPGTIVSNGTTALAFTITNSTGDLQQTGISFSDTLPPGLMFDSVTTNGCSGTMSISTDQRTITLTGGALPAGTHTCKIIIKVKATGVCGLYRNNKENLTHLANLDVSDANGELEVVECPTGLTVQKKVQGAPDGFAGQFTFLVQCATTTGFYQQTVTVNWPTPGFIVLNDIPPGSHCTVTEGALPAPLPTGYNWDGLPAYTPDGGVVTTTDAGGQVTVINKLKPCVETGQVKITKIVAGLPQGYSGVFQGTLQCWSGGMLSTYPVTLTSPNGLTTTINNLPLGSTCTFQETSQAPLPSGTQWDPPIYSPTFGTVTLTGLCCQEITATNKARACCEKTKELYDSPKP